MKMDPLDPLHLWIFFGGIAFGGLCHLIAVLIRRRIGSNGPRRIEIGFPKKDGKDGPVV